MSIKTVCIALWLACGAFIFLYSIFYVRGGLRLSTGIYCGVFVVAGIIKILSFCHCVISQKKVRYVIHKNENDKK